MFKLQVGKTLITDERLKRGCREASYTDVPNNKEWVDAKVYLPHEFDLVLVKFKDESVQKGWRTQFAWDGLHMKRGREVLFWKIWKDDSNSF